MIFFTLQFIYSVKIDKIFLSLNNPLIMQDLIPNQILPTGYSSIKDSFWPSQLWVYSCSKVSLHFPASPNDKLNERVLPRDFLNDNLKLPKYSPENSPFVQIRSKSNRHELPKGHSRSWSPSPSSGHSANRQCCWRNWNPIIVTHNKGNSPFFHEWKDKVPNAAGCIFLLIKYIICQNYFSLNILMEILGRSIH